MRRAVFIAPLIILIAAAPAKPWEKYQQQQRSWYLPVTITGSDGLGHEASCASAASDLNGNTGSSVTLHYWVFGYFSGANAANHAMVGHTTDSAGIIGEVKLYCEAHPSATIDEATAQAYNKMVREGH